MAARVNCQVPWSIWLGGVQPAGHLPMEGSATLTWLCRGRRRRENFRSLTQPLTASQLGRRTKLTLKACSSALKELRDRELVICLTPSVPRARLFWLTRQGKTLHMHLARTLGQNPIQLKFPEVDWLAYSKVCHRHRTAVISTLERAMHPAQIARRARFHDRNLCMSANNTRDVLQVLQQLNLVEQVRTRKRHHPLYKLTSRGETFQELLRRANTPTP